MQFYFNHNQDAASLISNVCNSRNYKSYDDQRYDETEEFSEKRVECIEDSDDPLRNEHSCNNTCHNGYGDFGKKAYFMLFHVG